MGSMGLKHSLQRSGPEDIRNTLVAISVVAALLAQLTYTAVLTPPQELSDCTDLCPNTLAMATYLNALVLLANDSNQLPLANLTYLSSYAQLPGPIQFNLAARTKAFLCLNSFALFLALASIIVATLSLCMRARLQEQGHPLPPHQITTDAVCYAVTCALFLMVLAALCAFAAFTVAHYTVIYYPGFTRNNNAFFTIIAFAGFILLLTGFLLKYCVRVCG